MENYEKTIAGTESKLSMLGQKHTPHQQAAEQYSRALVAENDKLRENYSWFTAGYRAGTADW